MSSGASVSALQRLVEQLKLEAGVERIKVSVRPGGQGRQTLRRGAARRRPRPGGSGGCGAGRTLGPRVLASRAWMRSDSRPDPRASAGAPTGAPGDAACPRDQVRGPRGRVCSRLATRWRPGLCPPSCRRMLFRDGREATKCTDVSEMDAGEGCSATLGDREGELGK